MTGWLDYHGCRVECANCGAMMQQVNFVVLSHNQYGARIRVFCNACNRTTDIESYGKGRICLWHEEIFGKPYSGPMYVKVIENANDREATALRKAGA